MTNTPSIWARPGARRARATGARWAGGLTAAIAIVALLAVPWLAVFLALVGAVDAYISALWTLAYRRFDREPAPAATAQPLPA